MILIIIHAAAIVGIVLTMMAVSCGDRSCAKSESTSYLRMGNQ